jgi:energy coupling factor transporter S component ThiW
MTFTALFVALGVLTAQLVYIPVGVSKCFPVQSAINILLAVLLGTRYSVNAAFTTSLLRNFLGTGTLLAFSGSMIGAALAGVLYRRTQNIFWAAAGELIGTGLIGALAAFPVARYLIGSKAGALFFVGPFAVSAAGGAVIACLLYYTPVVVLIRDWLKTR